jgi:Leucine Rich repeat
VSTTVTTVTSHSDVSHGASTQLQSLSLAYCTLIGDSGVGHLARALTALQRVNLSGCVGLSDDGVAVLAEACPHIQSLVLSQCSKLTDR